MIDIYKIEDPCIKGHYADKVVFDVLCHTSYGSIDDKDGKFWEKDKWYKASLEFHTPNKDTNNQEFRACWISFNDKFGSRFSVLGNVYHSDSGKPYWPHFTKIFYCPVQLARDRKIEECLL
jgi:hypothetical protein